MKKSNVLIVFSLLVMLLFVVFSYRLYNTVEAQKIENQQISDSLRVLLDSNLSLIHQRDSLVAKLLAKTAGSEKTVSDSTITNVVRSLKNVSESSMKLNNLDAYNAVATLERAGIHCYSKQSDGHSTPVIYTHRGVIAVLSYGLRNFAVTEEKRRHLF